MFGLGFPCKLGNSSPWQLLEESIAPFGSSLQQKTPITVACSIRLINLLVTWLLVLLTFVYLSWEDYGWPDGNKGLGEYPPSPPRPPNTMPPPHPRNACWGKIHPHHWPCQILVICHKLYRLLGARTQRERNQEFSNKINNWTVSVMCAWQTLLLWGLRDNEIGLGFGEREAYIYLHGCVGWAICLEQLQQ